jgi:hypothetical protein
LWNGIESFVNTVSSFFQNLGGQVITWIGNALDWLYQKGRDIIEGLARGLSDRFSSVVSWFQGIPGSIIGYFGRAGELLLDIGRQIIQGLWDGMKEIFKKMLSWLKGGMGDIANTVGDGMVIRSPSHVMRRLGQFTMEGFYLGMKDMWETTISWLKTVDPSELVETDLGANMQKALSSVAHTMSNMEEFAPTITPVLDLTQVQKDAAQISSFIGSDKLTPSVSIDHANVIAKTSVPASAEVTEHAAQTAGDVSFTQVINAPERLSTADIYKQTRNQFTIAKEELGIA